MNARTWTIGLLAAGWCLAGCELAGPAYEQPGVQEEAASMRSPIVGLAAPDFTLSEQNGTPVSLGDLRGRWVVLYFYPEDDTPGCTCQAAEFNRIHDGLRGMNAKVYGVSPDPPEIHRIFILKHQLKLDLLSDPDRAMMRNYGAWVDARFGELAYQRLIRSTVLIDPQGVVRYHWPEVIPKGHAERVREKLAMLQARSVAMK